MFFSEKDLYNSFSQVYTDLNQIPCESIKLDDFGREIDAYNFIQEHGDGLFDYLVEPFRRWQPGTYHYLSNGKLFYAVHKSPYPNFDDITQLGLIVNNRVCYIKYTAYTYEEGKNDYPTIPLAILNSWLYRAQGWDVAESIAIDIHRGVLPSAKTYSVSPIDSIIGGFTDKTDKALPQYTEFLESKFNHPFRQSYHIKEFMDDKYFELRCLLDTRLDGDWGKNGFQLFVSSHNTERNVYVVPRTDVMQIKKLSNPAEAIDSYAAHLLSGKEGEFDFLQYSEDF
ncbi:hypothetical protein [Pelistega suis]|uniref:hypothetical protein n=1 Tax=Pelistega suis TaxID=1631957 RepID=UPI00211B9716|nr:hypothetical protein [Pelistega suis]MCQ9329372.1 hypothetical protein [Pelistega suis]